MASNSKSSVYVQRVILAPQEKVFNAWLDPEVRLKWWNASSEHECTLCEIDARVGGKYRLGMSKSENQWIVTGEFIKIQAHECLEFSWTWEHDPSFGGDSIVSVLFNPIVVEDTPATEILLTHDKLESPLMRSEHNHGWVGCLHSLSLLYGPESDCHK